MGPFTGRVRQDFPADLPGQYFNKVDFGGVLRARLLGNYEKTGNRVDLVFLWTEFSLGPLKFKKEFPAGFKGHWNLKYVDNDMRVFSTNKGNVFVLSKVVEGVHGTIRAFA
ncbi:hypothetical protein WJX81_006351 [Elliptochloris bilobata]|uniref:Uncharacterized protein n=1 Tax=Elliptochloris bilobata TaxID=381761 RepID=A0AAW1R320_9CHLO